MPQPYKVFTIYAREDAPYLEELRGQLRPLEIGGRIKVWSDREINPGVDWEQEIVQHLDTADIILILVSAAYYNSVYIHEKEIKYALARHEKGEAKVLPIIVRPVDFSDDPIISRLQVLPTDGRPVTDRRQWPERDDAWVDVVAGIKRTINLLLEAENRRVQEAREVVLAIERREQEALLAVAQAAERQQLALEQQKETTARAEKAERERVKNEQLAAAQEVDRLRLAAQRKEEKRAKNERAMAENRIQKTPVANSQPQDPASKDASRLPPARYAFLIGGGVLILLALWLALDFFKEKEEPQQGARTLSPSSLPENVGVQVKKSGLVMVAVEGGTFNMGSPKNEKDRSDDECQHTVTVGPFNIGKYEVTQADWRNIMGNDPSNFKNCDDCPVEQVSWDDVQAFLKKLNIKYPGKNYRLPTEAEWEYAARGGAKSQGYQYAGSNTLGDVAWYDKNADSKTHPVGSKSPNELGLLDMSGNVWEWCQDSWKPYPGCSVNAKGDDRVFRGGGWYAGPQYCRVADRYSYSPTFRNLTLGFRLARSF